MIKSRKFGIIVDYDADETSLQEYVLLNFAITDRVVVDTKNRWLVFEHRRARSVKLWWDSSTGAAKLFDHAGATSFFGRGDAMLTEFLIGVAVARAMEQNIGIKDDKNDSGKLGHWRDLQLWRQVEHAISGLAEVYRQAKNRREETHEAREYFRELRC